MKTRYAILNEIEDLAHELIERASNDDPDLEDFWEIVNLAKDLKEIR